MQTYLRLITGQLVKAPKGSGFLPPYYVSPEVLRSFRSKYQPHVGEKQKAKAARQPTIPT